MNAGNRLVHVPLGERVELVTPIAGVGQRRIKPQIERARGRIDRWNRYPLSVFFFSATVGFPPMYLLGFIARPLMRIRFVPFTVLCLVGRFGRYTTIAVAALLAY